VFKNFMKVEETPLLKESERVLSLMTALSPATAEYAAMATQYDKLCEAESRKKERRVSLDTIAIIAANLVGIVLIMHYEQVHVLSSKAVSFVPKLKI